MRVPCFTCLMRASSRDARGRKGTENMVKHETLEIRHELRGGKGDAYLYTILGEEGLLGHGTTYARVVLPPGCSIGYHQHVGNTEPYYILSGCGIFTDADGSRIEVKPGDVCTIEPGQSHGMENAGDEDLVFMGLILNAD